MTLEYYPSYLTTSKYLICIAALLSSISAASLYSLAEATSALADIILLSANLLSFAAEDKVSCNS